MMEETPKKKTPRKKKTPVLTLAESNYRQAGPTMLNITQDVLNLEAAGEQVEVVVIVRGRAFNIYSAGATSDAGSAHVLLACAQRKMENAVLASHIIMDNGN